MSAADGRRPYLPETPAAWAALALVAGIALGSRSVEGEVPALLLAAASAALVALRFPRFGRSPGRRFERLDRFAGLLAVAALGFALARVRIARPAETARRAFARLPSDADRTDRVEGVLVDFWSGDPPHAHGRLRAERLWDAATSRWVAFPAEVFLFLSGEATDAPASVADRGDRVVIVGKLRPEGPPVSDRDVSSPWPVFRLSIKSALRIESRRPTWLSVLCLPNRWLHSRLPAPGSRDPSFDRDVRGPLAALLLGRTAELDRGMVARYRRGGMYHLLVIAGLHVGLAAALVLGLLRGAGVRGRRRDAILIAAVLLFILVGGANPPAVRAGIVFGVWALTRLLERPVAAGQTVGLSALVLFSAAPEQIYAIGTVLTFAAVSGIAAFGPLLRDLMPWRPRFVFSGLAAAVAAQIGTAPALLWRFNVVSAGAWLTAPLTIPLAGALIAVGSVLLLLFALGLPFGPVAGLFAAGSRVLELFAERMAGMAVLRPTPPLAAVTAVAALLGAGVVARGRGEGRLRIAAWSAAAALFLFLAARRGPAGPPRGFSLEALDVGQGDAILLRWDRRAVLVDGGGPLDGHARDFGRTRLLPKLLDRGVTRLDAVLLSHPHPDHAVGLFAVLEELPVGALWTSSGADENGFHRDLGAVAKRRRVPARALRAGSSVLWSDARLDVLAAGGERSKRDATNNESVVARFVRDGRSVLLTGDAGAFAESKLLRSGRTLASDVLKVGHHGSRGSSTHALLAAVAPRAALVSCGRENRFGHPHPETLASLERLGIRLFRTDHDSDVRIELLPGATRVVRRDLP